MFVVTQLIGLYIVNYYSPVKIIDGKLQNVSSPALPYGFETPEVEKQSDYYSLFTSIIIAFVFAIVLLFLLSKFEVSFVLKLWFFVVIVIALGIAFNSFFPFKYASIVAIAISLPLAFFKIYKPNFYIHNLTELLVYPGISAIFVPILNIWTMILLLIIISIYDAWAVWHSGIMQKMAKYQIDKLNVFSGFFVPYVSKKVKAQIQKFKLKPEKYKKKKIKVNVAILGGGDVVFPIIAAGVMLKTLGWGAALLVTLGATLGLAYLFFFAKKKKFYPAMPFISAGIFAGMLLGWILF